MKEDKFKKKNTFGVPENYFDNFQDRLFDKIEGLEETPILNSLKENDGFKVPKRYFDSASDRILNKVAKEPKVVNLFRPKYLRYITGVAASMLICFFGYSLFIDEKGGLEFEDVQAYLDNDLTNNYNSYELAELLQLENDQLNNINDLNFQDETVIDYLADQTDGYESLFDDTTLNEED